jgi:alpha-glucosidase (family GH31 glycosyl hydrolase)
MAGMALLLPEKQEAADLDFEVQIASVSDRTVRLTVLPIQDGKLTEVSSDGSLIQPSRAPLAKLRRSAPRTVKAGMLHVTAVSDPLSFKIETAKGALVQQLKFDPGSGVLTFATGNSPLLGLGEGGPQFDRRGSTDRMRSGQGGYQLRTHGGRVPIPWIISAAGKNSWAMFVHHPSGTFDFTGPESRFQSATPGQPLDIFFVAPSEPAALMAEYARITGLPELPPLWGFGYQQSHRTLASREEILAEARMFREKKLPCDTMIYLGTGFCPSGWNTDNGEFEFNRKVFPDPKAMFDELHRDHFKVALHVVIKARAMHGSVHDACDPNQPLEEQPACYWKKHQDVFATGVDGWWPDEGDPLNGPSRLARNRMYWEAPQLDRPNERPFALHRNGYPGIQRYASFLWSGDVYSTWETLKTHIPVAVNTGLSGIPLWGTDIGGFVPTPEFTSELYVRWFQFGAFCPLFRSHGRTWKLRLPWGWNTGDPGPVEVSNYNGAATPSAADLHDARIEPICRKYLELRYRMLPYLYSAVHESTKTGMPVMRALWLHYPDDPVAIARGDEFLWGRDILVAPVVEKGATSRTVYLPKLPANQVWYDFWTRETHPGGHEISKAVGLETMPLYVRAGAILPLGPVRQYTDEKVDEPITIEIFPGADGSFLLYEDDGRSFNYRKGEWSGTQMSWNDGRKILSLRLVTGSRMLTPRRAFQVKLRDAVKPVTFEGRAIEVRF